MGYIDFRKTVDNVWKEGLWRVMRNLGYEERMLSVLKSMYL